jgi:hypothetical protein
MLVYFSLFIILLHNKEARDVIEANCKNATQKHTEFKQNKNKYIEPCGRTNIWSAIGQNLANRYAFKETSVYS